MGIAKTGIGRLRIVGFLEGISYILLLGVATPLKYLADNPAPTTVIGMAHGILFMVYVLLVIRGKFKYHWSLKPTFIALLAGIVPFGTFYADAKIFSKV